MTKFSTYQRPRTGTASGPFGPAGNGPRWDSGGKPGPYAPIRRVPDARAIQQAVNKPAGKD